MANNFCEKCGTKVEPNAHFCSVCGNKFNFAEDEASAESFVDISTEKYVEPIAENNSAFVSVNPIAEVQSEKPQKIKKASYKAEIFIFILSLICFAGSLVFFLAAKTELLDSIPVVYNLKYPDAQAEDEIPELTVDMAEEIINNSAWCFPYHYFYGKGMLNMDDYIIHPYSDVENGVEIKCYTAKGIETMEDYYSYFEKYATREYVELYLGKEHFIIQQNSKIYFVPNEWMGWYPVSAGDLIVEKIDDETYYVENTFWTEDEYIIKYIDGSFKVTLIEPKEAFSAYATDEDTVTVPDISGMSINEAEAELKRAGLTLDRENIAYVPDSFGEGIGLVFSAKYKYKKVAPGSAVGVYIAVEEPDFYRRGVIDGETVPELTIDEAIKIYQMASDSLYSSFNRYGLLDKDNPITIEYYSDGLRTAYPIKGIETQAEFDEMMSQYVTSSTYYSEPYIYNGKVYVVDTSDGNYDYTYNFSLVKYDDSTYFLYEKKYGSERVIIYVDGSFRLCSWNFTPDDVK